MHLLPTERTGPPTLMLAISFVVLAVAGCDRHYVVVGFQNDASPLVSNRTFGPPVLIDGLLDPTDDVADPTLSMDMRELFFSSTKNGTRDIWTSRRSAIGQPWEPATIVRELSTDSYDAEPSLSKDGLTIWFSSGRLGNQAGIRIWTAHRASPADPWGSFQKMNFSTAEHDQGPTVDATGVSMVFYSRTVSGDAALFRTSRKNASASWDTPVPVSELNISHWTLDPGLHSDGLGLVFGSAGGDGQASADLYESVRPVNGSFSMPVARSELNSLQDEGDPWLSDDGRYIIFSSSRSGVSRLYEARR